MNNKHVIIPVSCFTIGEPSGHPLLLTTIVPSQLGDTFVIYAFYNGSLWERNRIEVLAGSLTEDRAQVISALVDDWMYGILEAYVGIQQKLKIAPMS